MSLRRHFAPLATDSISPLNLPPVQMGLLTKLNLLTVGLIFLTAIATTGLYVWKEWRGSEAELRAQGSTLVNMPPDPATTRIVVENSLLSKNSGDGAFVGGITDGQVLATFSRNTITGNSLSGISAFNTITSGVASVTTFDNAFSRNGNRGIKVDGFPSQVFLSRNYFAADESAFVQAHGGFFGTFGDNTGNHSGATLTTFGSPF